jgi:hypothetical protein
MIRYIQHKEIDLRKWDACIDKALNGNIYAYSWYLNNVCSTWDVLVEDDYVSVMPLPFRKKMGVNYIYPPTMTQQLGVFSREIISENKIQKFISCIPSKFKYCEINLNHYNPVSKGKIEISEHTNLDLDLNLPYVELQTAFSENTRRNIRKTEQINIRVWKTGDIKNLIQIFKNTKANDIKTLPDDFYITVEKVALKLIERKQAEVWEVSISNNLCAGILFGFSHNRAYFLFSAATAAAKENNIMHHLINTFIRENAGKNLILDFEGSDHKNLARFYKSFGASQKNYNKIIVNRLPNLLFSLARAIQKK